MQSQMLKPKFEVYPMEGSFKQKRYRYVSEELSNGKSILKRVEEDVELPAGYELFTARGDSVHVDEETLNRLGIKPNVPASLINEDGDEISAPVSLKRIAQARSISRKN